jgi:hypothetical protein
MIPKFNTSATTEFHKLNDSASRELSRSGFADDSKSIISEHRDDSSCDIFSAEGKQFSVSSAEEEGREAIEKEMVLPGSPVDCFGFPKTAALTRDLSNANSAGAQPSRKDTAPETVNLTSANEEFRNRQWFSVPPPPPLPPLVKRNTSASAATHKKDLGAGNVKDAILELAKKVAISHAFQATEWPEVSVPPPAPSKDFGPSLTPPPIKGKSLANIFEQQTLSETEIMTSFEKTFSPVDASSEASSFNKEDASSFMESVGNITMDAFGFPLVEPVTPAKSTGTKSTPKSGKNKSMPITPAKSVISNKGTPRTPGTNKSMRAVPVCAHDSPAKAVARIKSAPALNRLIANAQMQAHYKGQTAFQFQADFSIPDAPPSASGSAALYDANDGPKQNVEEVKPGAMPTLIRDLVKTESKIYKAKAPDTGVDKLIVGSMEDPRKSCEDKDACLAVSTELTIPFMNVDVSTFSPSFPRHKAPSMKPDGSFEANESSIALLDSSVELTFPQRRKKRLPSSKLRCTDDTLYCNINLKEVETTMWEFMDAFDERAGKCGYVIGCTDRIPKVVSTSDIDTSSLLEDEFLVNKAAQHSVSLLDSVVIDE